MTFNPLHTIVYPRYGASRAASWHRRNNSPPAHVLIFLSAFFQALLLLPLPSFSYLTTCLVMTWSEPFLTYTAFSFTHLRDGCFLGGTSGVSVCVIALAHPLNSAKTYVSFFTSRTITALAFVESVLVYSRMLSGYYVFFTPSLLFKLPPQIWRMFTSFLLTGSGISFIFDLYFSMMSRSAALVSSSVNSVHSVSLFKFAGDCFAPLYPARRFFHLSGFCSLCDFGKWLACPGTIPEESYLFCLLCFCFFYTTPRISARPAWN